MKKYEVIDNMTMETLIDCAGDTELTIEGLIDEAIYLLEMAQEGSDEPEGYQPYIDNIMGAQDESEKMYYIEEAMNLLDYMIFEL